MQRVTKRFEPQVIQAANDFEIEFEESVSWDVSMDFFPDIENATQDNVPLVATIGIYLELPGASEDTVVSGSIFTPPYLEDEQIFKAVFDSLVALREGRERSPSPSN